MPLRGMGMSKLIDLTGQKFGKLTVLHRIKTKKGTKWKCVCDCGNYSNVYSGNLKRKDKPTKSCGCLVRNAIIKRTKYEKIEFAYRKKVSHIKSDAWERNKDWALDYDFAISLIKDNCYYCGAIPSRPFTYKWKEQKQTKQITIFVNGIDRVNNTKGYTWNNVVSCCTTCNSAKNNMTIHQFNFWRNQIANHLKKEAKMTCNNNKLNILFDVDLTLIGSNDEILYDNVNILLSFFKLGCKIFVASGGGVNYAEMWVNRLSLSDKVTVIPKDQAKNYNIDIAFDDQAVNLGKVNVEV